ncbi:putative AP-4 complex subunit beta-1 isoform X1 [Apostichopus japonicus]|uniref:AP complex subunit beta n=1 Tax=Stichopus japonicus TaxID=307972 RepID=A0A2G8KTZ1_STIJA|nr:putative AP-4 complex subunit beta-1 isoform X1 [Apostichopus japonicus]
MVLTMSFFKEKDIVKETGEKLTQSLTPETWRFYERFIEIVDEMTAGIDKSALFPYMVKMCGTIDLTCKKLVYLYISQYAKRNPDVALLTINSLQKDCVDPNAMIRGLALKTLCNIRLPEFLEYLKEPLLSGMKDRSPYVRQIAVVGCLKVHKLQPTFAKDHNMPNFDELLYDTDAGVVVNAIKTFFEMRKDSGKDFSLKQKTAIYLFNKLPDFNDWGKATVLQLLLAYQPHNEEETVDILNLLDPLLQSTKSSVSIAGVKLMLHYTDKMPEVQRDIFKKLRGILVNLLTHEQGEVVYFALCHLQQLQKNSHVNLSKHYKKLFCRYNEPAHIKCLKIDILEMICNDKNWKDILEEINSHCLDLSPEVSDKAISAVSAIATKKEKYSTPAIKILLYLLEVDRVAGCALSALKDLLDSEPFEQFISDVFEAIPSLWSRVEDQRGKIAMLWIIGEHGKNLPDAPYLLESMIDNLEDIQRPLILSNLLTATTKLFFSRPAECQDMLGKLLEFCVESQDDLHLRDKGQIYYRLLSEDVNMAKEVIFSARTQIDQSYEIISEKSSPPILNSVKLFVNSKKKWTIQDDEVLQDHITQSDMTETPSSPVEGQLIDITAVTQDGEVKGESPLNDLSNELEETRESLETLRVPLSSVANQPAEEETTEQRAEDEGSSIELDKSFSVSPEEFESKWTTLQAIELKSFTTNLQITALLDALETEGISTMASTPEGTFPWRAFLFAKDNNTEAVFLLEVVLNSEDDVSAEITMKCTTDNSFARREFQGFLQEVISRIGK